MRNQYQKKYVELHRDKINAQRRARYRKANPEKPKQTKEERNKKLRDRYQKRKELGICTRCPKMAEKNRVLCQYHLDYAFRKKKEYEHSNNRTSN